MSAGVLFDAPGPKARMRHRVLGAVGLLLLAAIIGLVVWKFQQQGQFESSKWTPFVHGEIWNSYLVPGLMGTLKAAAISIVLACVLGGLLALGRLSTVKPIRWIASVIVEFFRAVPVLLMMIFSFGMYVKYNVVPSEQAPLAAVVTGLALYNGSVICEVIRSGVDQLPKGQGEAGLSVGLTEAQTLRSIMLPQAVTAMLPSLVSQLVVVLKDTALGYNVLYAELLYSSNDAASNYSNLVPVILVIAVIYIIINYTLTKIAQWIERRIARRGRSAVTGPDTGVGPGGPVGGPDMNANTVAG
ncbi:amino acid ABC transporter permease [Luteipulveratus halotolerans]|uniref:Amino acid ABC transporter permease n=1 Tax=Luteipulveratus halotolerans TaxID=1631356 RepID=A0A0L6CIT5_9MICO|nr:amino acid ABC transporter permease [Luteipulveratus halotolerans]KNX37418.1 amino acid ABC transporter permease [Luteipulveratus halotolerans]